MARQVNLQTVLVEAQVILKDTERAHLRINQRCNQNGSVGASHQFEDVAFELTVVEPTGLFDVREVEDDGAVLDVDLDTGTVRQGAIGFERANDLCGILQPRPDLYDETLRLDRVATRGVTNELDSHTFHGRDQAWIDLDVAWVARVEATGRNSECGH